MEGRPEEPTGYNGDSERRPGSARPSDWSSSCLRATLTSGLLKDDLAGRGLTLDVQAAGLLEQFDEAVAAEALEGGPGGSADHRLDALRNMIVSAQTLIALEEYDDACMQLGDAYARTDGANPRQTSQRPPRGRNGRRDRGFAVAPALFRNNPAAGRHAPQGSRPGHPAGAEVHKHGGTSGPEPLPLDFLHDAMQNRGAHQSIWDTARVPNGVYFLRLESSDNSNVAKTLILR